LRTVILEFGLWKLTALYRRPFRFDQRDSYPS
jgi:CRISPR-associated Cas5-like protein